MKHSLFKILLILTIISTGAVASNAQEIGARFGDISGGNIAVDGIFGIGKYNRLHADVSFGTGIGGDILWDFLYRPLGDATVNYYVGIGPYIWVNDPLWLGAVAEIGLEYRFDSLPIAIGADWRPAFSLIEKTGFHTSSYGINVRYIIAEPRYRRR